MKKRRQETRRRYQREVEDGRLHGDVSEGCGVKDWQ